jgi:hypothetical protein
MALAQIRTVQVRESRSFWWIFQFIWWVVAMRAVAVLVERQDDADKLKMVGVETLMRLLLMVAERVQVQVTHVNNREHWSQMSSMLMHLPRRPGVLKETQMRFYKAIKVEVQPAQQGP